MDPYFRCFPISQNTRKHQQTSTVPRQPGLQRGVVSLSVGDTLSLGPNTGIRPTLASPWWRMATHIDWTLQSQKCQGKFAINPLHSMASPWHIQNIQVIDGNSVRVNGFQSRGTSHCWRMWSASATGHDNPWQSEGLRSNLEYDCLNFIHMAVVAKMLFPFVSAATGHPHWYVSKNTYIYIYVYHIYIIYSIQTWLLTIHHYYVIINIYIHHFWLKSLLISQKFQQEFTKLRSLQDVAGWYSR